MINNKFSCGDPAVRKRVYPDFSSFLLVKKHGNSISSFSLFPAGKQWRIISGFQIKGNESLVKVGSILQNQITGNRKFFRKCKVAAVDSKGTSNGNKKVFQSISVKLKLSF